jgi:hypothetical protein
LAALEEDVAEFSQFYYGEVLEGMGPDGFIGGGAGGGAGGGQGGRGRTNFVLVQHYFRVPISHRGWEHERDVCPRKHKLRRGRRPHANGAYGAATNSHPALPTRVRARAKPTTAIPKTKTKKTTIKICSQYAAAILGV